MHNVYTIFLSVNYFIADVIFWNEAHVVDVSECIDYDLRAVFGVKR